MTEPVASGGVVESPSNGRAEESGSGGLSLAVRWAVIAGVAVVSWLVAGLLVSQPGERLLVLGLPVHLAARGILRAWPPRAEAIRLGVLVAVVPVLIGAAAAFLASQMGGRVLLVEVAIASWFLLSALAIAHGIDAGAGALGRALTERPRVAASVRGVLTASLALPFLCAALQAHRIKIGNAEPGSFWPVRDVRLETEDGLGLSAWYLPNDRVAARPGPAVVFVHGVSANRSNFLPLAEVPRSLGYHVLLFDLRGHGDSDGHSVSFGVHEAKDVLAARDFLAARPEVDPDRIVAVGCSLGSAAVVGAAARRPDAFAGIVLDSPFADVDALAAHIYRFIPPPVRRPFLEMVFLIGRIETGGRDLRALEPRANARRVTVPALVIHGTDDPVIPVEQGRLMHATLSERVPAALEVFEGAIHCGSENADPARYRRALSSFLEARVGRPGT